LIFTGLYGISQKKFFVVSTVRAWNPVKICLADVEKLRKILLLVAIMFLVIAAESFRSVQIKSSGL
jgi:hypothetical protein